MTTSVLEQSSPVRPAVPAWARSLALDATVPAVLFASAAIVIGLHWDIAWHRAIGRDTFWSPPHVLEQVAAAMAGLFCGWRVIYTSFFAPQAARDGAVRWWKLFYGPLGGWVCIWGTIAMITSAPFDDWWHAAYGLDVEILTPPHTFLLLGMVSVQLGAMLMMLAEQNRGAASARSGAVFAASMGLIVLMVATMVYAETGLANFQHRPAFFQISGALFPLFLLAVARAGRTRWPATIAAATYTVIMILLNWVLALVPATPLLAPIYNPVTTLVPPGFPLLIIVPALLIDLLVARFKGSDWLLAPAVGVAFIATLLVVQWPFASFLLSLDQPNYWFGQGYWDYTARLGPWTKQFHDVPGYQFVRGQGFVGSLDVRAMVVGLAIATLLAAISSRLGLAWGRWMSRVRR
ncbi:MAG: hypothetical protein ACKVZ0_03345 [Gemmatimonadales bacterium]